MKSAFQQLAMSLTGVFGDIFTAATLYKDSGPLYQDGQQQTYAITKIMIEDVDSGKGKKIFGEKFNPEYRYALIPALAIESNVEIKNGDKITRPKNEAVDEKYTVQHHKIDAAGASYELLLSVDP